MTERRYSMPWGFPWYTSPPFRYTGNRLVSVTFETEAAALRRLVPEPLVPNPDGLAWPALAATSGTERLAARWCELAVWRRSWRRSVLRRPACPRSWRKR